MNKKTMRKILSMLLSLAMLVSLLAGLSLTASAAVLTGTSTGYTKASDVNYVTVSGTVANWGARGETATFLTTYAQSYYTGSYSYATLSALSGDSGTGTSFYSSALGSAIHSMLAAKQTSTTSYNGTKDLYKYTDCVNSNYSYISSYYSGTQLNGAWDGSTWNREHTWPQSKGADKGTPMGYDMQSVRPAGTAINSDRGSTPYGESSKFYDPNEIAINNSLYAPEHLGSYRGDCARVILYDYVVYGKAGGYSNDFYQGNAQLLSKLGKNGVFESIPILLKWHMQDPSSLTEMVRNDGAQAYQGNRNPFIDYPELAIQMLKDQVTSYPVSVTGAEMWPAYSLTLNTGFIAYMGTKTSRPKEVTVTGADYEYDKVSGRLIITKVKGAVTISVASAQALERTEDGQQALKTIHNGQIVIIKNGKAYSILGAPVGDIR